MLNLLLKIKTYIEENEEAKDGEYGVDRSLDKIIADGDMPELYSEVLEAIHSYLKPPKEGPLCSICEKRIIPELDNFARLTKENGVSHAHLSCIEGRVEK